MDSRLAQGRSFMTKFTRWTKGRNGRSIVLSVSAVCWAWCLFSAVSFFRNASDYQGRDIIGGSKLAQLSTVIGALYVLLLAILSFGVYASYSHKYTPVHTYAHLSVVGAVIFLAAGILNIAYFFQLKDEIIAVCESIGFDDKIFWLFIGSAVGPITTNLNVVDFGHDENQELPHHWCAREWSKIATGNVVIFIVTSLVASCLSILVFLYTRQILNRSYTPKAVELADHPTAPPHYTQPYKTSTAGRPDVDANYGTPGGLFPGYNPYKVPTANRGNEDVGDQTRQKV